MGTAVVVGTDEVRTLVLQLLVAFTKSVAMSSRPKERKMKLWRFDIIMRILRVEMYC